MFETLLIESIITSPVPSSFLSNPFTLRFFQYAAPSFALPSKGLLFKTLLPNEIESVRSKVSTSLRQNPDSLTLSFDILTTVFDQTFFLIYATTSLGTTYCYAGHEFPDQPPSAEVFASLLSTSIDSIGDKKVAALICPAKGLYGEIRALVASRYPHLLALDPLDHFFEKLAVDLCRHQLVDNVIRTMLMIFGYFHRSSLAERLLTLHMNNLHITDGLRPFLPNEPISLYEAAVSMQRCMPALVEVVSSDQSKLDKSSMHSPHSVLFPLPRHTNTTHLLQSTGNR
ncbi:hypothetical protein BZA70DRAFT_142431 [Myxozyma melibiosi]|uniref:Uncharacterized protein n=1 Tax=Myxozyma melibiosi TaxID=54550 RepID=A0ABR1F7H2_9ASCO